MRASSFVSVRVAVLLVCLLLLRVAPAAASSIQLTSQSFSGGTDLIGMTPFDPSLGTLDAISVTITGVLTVTGTTAPLIVGGAPVPYTYRVSVDQDFTGTGGDYFDFATPATFIFDSIAAGTGGPLTLVENFSYTFTFTSTTDLFGFVVPSFSGADVPPTSINAVRSDFVSSPGSANEIVLTHTASGLALSGPAPTGLSASSEGSVIVEYRYTPAAVPTAAAVPEPGTVGLVGIGLAAVRAGIGRRRRHGAR